VKPESVYKEAGKEQGHDPQYPYPRAVDVRALPGTAARNGQAEVGGGPMSGARQTPTRFVASIAGFLLKLGSGLKQLDTREKQVMYDH
jgi:hypothetical protein